MDKKVLKKLIFTIGIFFYYDLFAQSIYHELIDSLVIPTSYEDNFCIPFNEHQIFVHPYSQDHAFLLDWKTYSIQKIYIQTDKPAIIVSFDQFNENNNIKFVCLYRKVYSKFFKLWFGAQHLMSYSLSNDTLFLKKISRSLWVYNIASLNEKYFLHNFTDVPFALFLGRIQNQKLIKKRILHFKNLGLKKDQYNFNRFDNQLIINHAYADTFYCIDFNYNLENLKFQFQKKFSHSNYYTCKQCYYGTIGKHQNFYYQVVIPIKKIDKYKILFWKDLKEPPYSQLELNENEFVAAFYENYLLTYKNFDGGLVIKKYALK